MGLKYGPVRPELGIYERKFPLEASQKVHEAGCAFFTATAGTGHLGLTVTADTKVTHWLTGYAHGPGLVEVTGSYGSRVWTSSATAGTEYMAKPLSPGEEYFCKAAQVHALAYEGDGCDIIGHVSDGTAQTVDTDTGTNDLFRIIDGVVGVAEVYCAPNAAALFL